MSQGFFVEASTGDEPQEEQKMRIFDLCRCRIVFGPVPMSSMKKLTKGFSKEAVIDPDLAVKSGATLLIGTPENLDVLKTHPDFVAMVNLQNQKYRVFGEDTFEWLTTGDRGLSSETMLSVIKGLELRDPSQYRTPSDPSDLRRCLLLMHNVNGIKQGFQKMRTVSEKWNALVDRWDELTKVFSEEYPGWESGQSKCVSCPETYRLMKEILDEDVNPINTIAILPTGDWAQVNGHHDVKFNLHGSELKASFSNGDWAMVQSKLDVAFLNLKDYQMEEITNSEYSENIFKKMQSGMTEDEINQILGIQKPGASPKSNF